MIKQIPGKGKFIRIDWNLTIALLELLYGLIVVGKD
jgi:hypothetical protein